MSILKAFSYISIIVVSTTWTIAGITIIKKLSLINEFKDETEKNIKNATEKISNTADKITKISNRIFGE